MSHPQTGDLDFSVIVPTYQRPQLVKQCIQSLIGQNYPKERFEIIVVHDGPGAAFEPLSGQQTPGPTIKYFSISKAGVSAARNKGIQEASGRWLAFTDDDCAPDPEWLKVLGKYLAIYPETIIGGCTINGLAGNYFAEASATLEQYIYDYQYKHNMQSTQTPYFAAKNFAMAKDQFWRVGDFDTTMVAAEDRDFCDRWQQSGGKLRYVPQALVRHYHDLNWIGFIRQHFFYGRSNYQYHQQRMQRGGQKNRVESRHFYKGLITAPRQNQTGLTAVLISFLLLLSQAANAAGYLTARLSTIKENRGELDKA